MKKGFTLIEMIGSIVILAMIALIAFPAVLNLLNSSQSKVDDGVKNYIIGAAREYVSEHVNCYPKNSNATMPSECGGSVPVINDDKLTVGLLLNQGYASEKSITEDMKNDYIKVTTNGTIYEYEYNEVS